MIKLLGRLAKRFWREDGTASAEFVICVPLVFFVFASAMDSGLAVIRETMLERSVDMAMRELRLGHYTNPTDAMLKTEICKNATMVRNCDNQIAIDIRPVNRSTWVMPDRVSECVNRAQNLKPATTLVIGQQNVIMLVRVCVVQDSIFPYTGFGLRMAVNKDGYRLTAISSFVNEPG